VSERVGEWESGRVGEWESGRVGGGAARRKNETMFRLSTKNRPCSLNYTWHET
jgi:hypothetical protein